MSALSLAARVDSPSGTRLDLALDVPDGETVAILGPNGAGKSTLLAAVAGLVATTGHIRLDGRDVAALPPHRRGIALLAQDPLLFPHLTAADNVAFGPRARGVGRAEASTRARDLLAQVGVAEFAGRRPARLSGGQAQRVAIARALATSPSVLLLDEPMAALDVDVTPALRQTLRSVLAGRTTLIVTHDVLDALLLADRVVVLDQGRIVEQGPTAEILSRPRSPFAARLAGLNLLAGTWGADGVLATAAGPIHGLVDPETGPAPQVRGPAIALFRPSAVSIHRAAPEGSPRNHLAVTVSDIEPSGDRVRVRARTDAARGDVPLTAEVTPAAVAELALAPGERVTFSIKATEVTVHAVSAGSFKAETGSGVDTVGP